VADPGRSSVRWRLARLLLARLLLARLLLAGRPLARLWPALVITAVVTAVAGCVSMPDSGPVGQISADPQNTVQAGSLIEPVPVGPAQNDSPAEIVTGFLAASAGYPVGDTIAAQYLVSAAVKGWHPSWAVTVFSTLGPTMTKALPAVNGSPQAEVEFSGDAEAKVNASGEFTSTSAGKRSGYLFKLVKVDGQWRISNPPNNYRLLTTSQFSTYYRAQDLYYFSQVSQLLVPDPVFVPVGTETADLASNLVQALMPDPTGPMPVWLQNATTTFPPGTKVLGVTLDASTAVVNLGGTLPAVSQAILKQLFAQLVWTLTSAQARPSLSIQSVELELDGRPWTPGSDPCGAKIESPVQNRASYECYDPYPPVTASFSFTSNGQLWSRCGAQSYVQAAHIGPVVPVFSAADAISAQKCGGQEVAGGSPKVPSSPAQQPHGVGSPSMVAVAPTGQYVASYSPGKNAVLYIGSSASAADLTPVKGIGTGVTALSWDQNNDLWVAEDGSIYVVTPGSNAVLVQFQGPFTSQVTGLSVAPDGVRIALVTQDSSGNSEVGLAAIDRPSAITSGQPGSGSPGDRLSLTLSGQLGSNVTDPAALTWYDADDLIVLGNASSGSTVWQVPVDGQEATESGLTPPGPALSISADSDQSALVAGLANGQIAVAAGLEAQWLVLGVPGRNPAYPG
jgi:hypothetical protein